MAITKLLLLLAIGLGAMVNHAGGREPVFRFLVVGDLPYSDEEEVQFRRLLKQSEQDDFAFLMHVGDTKAQNAPCSDETYQKTRGLMRNYPKPVVYTLGDNEWTDCHHSGGDPIERLDRLRELFFQDGGVLRLQKFAAKHQSDDPQFARFIENYRFTKSGVLFIAVHVCGSDNNRRPEDPAAMEEFADRNAANLAFLKESLAEAVNHKTVGVVIAMHADLKFKSRHAEGFHDTIAAMEDFAANYPEPIVCIHGDTHFFRVDNPLTDDAGHQTHLHFTRMEVFGAPNVAGVSVTVDPQDPQVFSFRPYFLRTAEGG